ncbi:MAG: sigma 54-interacting transcriptional regulator [Candidatus Krumholzibacteriota bacterium]|nr:sigma 54-interacting transcriptional regulator [Candidatus Krumholzibacteriota bacterium]
MPDDPQGKGEFEYDKNQPGNQYKSVCSEEELGDMHLATENYTVALEYYEKALQRVHKQTGEPGDLVRLYRKISDCYRKKGLLREASTFLESASSHCSEEDQIGKGTIACRRAIIMRGQGQIKEALREGCAAYKILRKSDQHKEVAHTQLLIANCYFRLGQHDEAEQFFLDALSSYRRINDSVGESYVLNNLGLFHKNACRWGRALQFLNKAMAICEEIGLSQHRVRVTLNLGVVHLKKRDFANAESSFSAARAMASRIGDELKYTRATLMLGVKETRCGNLIAAEKHLLEARVLAERRNYRREIALADEFAGDLMLIRGDISGALENYTIALSEAKKISPVNDIVAEVVRRIMYVHLIQKKPQQVISMSENAIGTCKKAGELHEIGYMERTIGQAYALIHDDNAAEKKINQSIRTFLSVNNPYDAHISGVALGELLIKRGDRKSVVIARKLVGETISFFERNEEFKDLANSHFLLAKIEETLGNRDESLLHIYESERLAEDLCDRNLNRRLRRMRRKIETDTAGTSLHAGGAFKVPQELSGCFVHDPHLHSYLDYILSDMMRKVAAGHGFVALAGSGTTGERPLVLARNGISEDNTCSLTDWFMKREGVDLTEKFLITDTPKDRRTKDVRELLPETDSPVYFHPMVKDGRPFGLIFFQSENDGSKAPRVGSVFDVVSTYAGFIGFLVRGILGNDNNVEEEKFDRGKFQRIITRSDSMLRILDLAEKVAGSDSTVLLMGETGTGKGLIAKAIHRLSTRGSRSFIHVNCAALPEQLLESELFGHVKGAFTGAVADKKGLLAEADGGTIFLDEIDKSPLSIQGKLLQFLDSRMIRPVGGNEMIEVDVRLIFASKMDLISKCSDGTVLEDFFYRINDFPITVPPLRDRIEDITLLAEHYLKLFCDGMGKKIVGFSEEAVSFLRGNRWPGNVRELEKIIKRAVILSSDNGVITPAQLTVDGAVTTGRPYGEEMTLPERIRELEEKSVSETLKENSWNRKAAAEQLGISYPTLLKKIRDFGLSSD